MGIKTWRNLSVLLLVGAVLAGCNNTPDKKKSVLKEGPPTPNSGLANQSQPFPTKANTPTNDATNPFVGLL